MPTPRAMFSILSVTCLLTRKPFNYYSRLAHVLNVERFCYVCASVLRIIFIIVTVVVSPVCLCVCVRACVRVCACVCACVRACVRVCSFLPPRASRPRNTCSPQHGKNYIYIYIYIYNCEFLLKMFHSEATVSFACLECN